MIAVFLHSFCIRRWLKEVISPFGVTASIYCADRNIQMGDCWCCWFHVCHLRCCKSPCAHCKFWRAMVPDRCRDILTAVGACCFTETIFLHDNCIGLFTSMLVLVRNIQFFKRNLPPYSLNLM